MDEAGKQGADRVGPNVMAGHVAALAQYAKLELTSENLRLARRLWASVPDGARVRGTAEGKSGRRATSLLLPARFPGASPSPIPECRHIYTVLRTVEMSIDLGAVRRPGRCCRPRECRTLRGRTRDGPPASR